LEGAAFLQADRRSPRPAKAVSPLLEFQNDATSIERFLDAMMVGGEAVVASSETVNSVGETAALGETVEKTAVNVWQRT